MAVVLLGACYVYVPVELGSREALSGEQVRVHVQPDAARRISAEAGRPMSELEGRFLETNGDSIRISVAMARGPQGRLVRPIRQEFSASVSEVLQIQRAELSRQRTFLFGAGIIAALAFTISRMTASEGGGTLPPTPSFPEAPTRVPVPTIMR